MKDSTDTKVGNESAEERTERTATTPATVAVLKRQPRPTRQSHLTYRVGRVFFANAAAQPAPKPNTAYGRHPLGSADTPSAKICESLHDLVLLH